MLINIIIIWNECYYAPEEGQEAETLSKLNVLKLEIWSWLLDPHAYSYLARNSSSHDHQSRVILQLK